MTDQLDIQMNLPALAMKDGAAAYISGQFQTAQEAAENFDCATPDLLPAFIEGWENEEKKESN